MKPENWNEMPKKQKLMLATNLLRSMRGQLIMSQALFLAARTLREEEYPEESNAQDMDILAEMFFPMYIGIQGLLELQNPKE